MNPVSLPLTGLRCIVTAHDSQANGIIQRDAIIPMENMPEIKGALSSTLWVIGDAVPTNDNNCDEDGAVRLIDNARNMDLVHPTGINCRTTDLEPGAITPMHRTSSMDFNILISGELTLILEDGTERTLQNPGDTVVQKGTMHAWRNPSSQYWARWISILVSAHPTTINGVELEPACQPLDPK